MTEKRMPTRILGTSHLELLWEVQVELVPMVEAIVMASLEGYLVTSTLRLFSNLSPSSHLLPRLRSTRSLQFLVREARQLIHPTLL